MASSPEARRLEWLAALEDLAAQAERLATQTPYGFARYGGRLNACQADRLQDLADSLRKDSEVLL